MSNVTGPRSLCPMGVALGAGADGCGDPVDVVGHLGVDARLVLASAAVSPADDAVQDADAVLSAR